MVVPLIGDVAMRLWCGAPGTTDREGVRFGYPGRLRTASCGTIPTLTVAALLPLDCTRRVGRLLRLRRSEMPRRSGTRINNAGPRSHEPGGLMVPAWLMGSGPDLRFVLPAEA